MSTLNAIAPQHPSIKCRATCPQIRRNVDVYRRYWNWFETIIQSYTWLFDELRQAFVLDGWTWWVNVTSRFEGRMWLVDVTVGRGRWMWRISVTGERDWWMWRADEMGGHSGRSRRVNVTGWRDWWTWRVNVTNGRGAGQIFGRTWRSIVTGERDAATVMTERER